MATFKELLKRTFDLWVMKRWLVEINKELDLYNKYESKSGHYKNEAYHHKQVVKKLYDEYCEKYNKKDDGND